MLVVEKAKEKSHMNEVYDLIGLSPERIQALLKKLMALVRPGATGKWRRPSIPRSGWTRVRRYDAYRTGEYRKCETCEARRIRYVHAMMHPKLPGIVLRVGRTCARHMEKDASVATRDNEGAQ